MNDQINDVNIDDIEIDTSSQSGEIPMTASEPTPEPQPAEQTYDFQFGDQTKQYSHNQIQELLQNQDNFLQKQQEFDQRYKTYEEIDRVAQENPDWWEHVQQSYSQRDQYQAPTQTQEESQFSGDPAFAQLQQQLAEQQQFIEGLKTQQQQQIQAEQDKILNEQINQIKKDYPELQWNKVNDRGQTLEQQVLTYAQERNIPDFESAFKASQFDSLTQYKVSRALENVQKTKADELRNGLLGYSKQPTQGVQDAKKLKSKTYDDLHREALEELGIS